jgi:glycogen synthase
VDVRRPLLGFIGRLVYQKGPDLMLDGLERLVGLDCQVGSNQWILIILEYPRPALNDH